MFTTKQKNTERKILGTAYDTYSKGLNAHAYFKVSNHEKSDDLVQDTFLKTWKYIVKGGKIILMKSFLYHILNDLIVDEYRKKKFVSLDILLKNGFESGFDEPTQLSNNFDGKTLVCLIDYLPQKYQKIIHMRYIDDMSLEEISQAVTQSKNSIAVQINRGLKKLKVLYKCYE
jgi:RNA polymerase sigma-70 factor (ECF subfamily)